MAQSTDGRGFSFEQVRQLQDDFLQNRTLTTDSTNASHLQNTAAINQAIGARSEAQIESDENLQNLRNRGMMDMQNSKNASDMNLLNTRLNAQQAMNTSNNLFNAVSNVGGGLIGGLLSGGISAGLIALQGKVQRDNFDYMTQTAENAYASSGLPSWLAFNKSGINNFPTTAQNLSGSAYLTSTIPGTVTANSYLGTATQAAMGVGQAPDM